MSRKVFIEGILLFVLSFVGISEGVHLIRHKEPHIVYDLLGPGYYILFISVALMATGIAHLIINYRKILKTEKVVVSKAMRMLMISMVLVMALYTFLINITGYLVATVVFFLLEFRIIGIKSWHTNIILTVILTAAYYIIFIHYCGMVFPRGILFK